MPKDSETALQFCLRWKQQVPEETHLWYVRRLAADLRFWGYVHIRTISLAQNRGFEGQFPPDLWTDAFSLISRIRTSGMTGIARSLPSDGALLEGDAGTGTPLIECNAADDETSESARAFYELVRHLQPHVAAAAALST